MTSYASSRLAQLRAKKIIICEDQLSNQHQLKSARPQENLKESSTPQMQKKASLRIVKRKIHPKKTQQNGTESLNTSANHEQSNDLKLIIDDSPKLEGKKTNNSFKPFLKRIIFTKEPIKEYPPFQQGIEHQQQKPFHKKLQSKDQFQQTSKPAKKPIPLSSCFDPHLEESAEKQQIEKMQENSSQINLQGGNSGIEIKSQVLKHRKNAYRVVLMSKRKQSKTQQKKSKQPEEEKLKQHQMMKKL